jgi:hypothetical protein
LQFREPIFVFAIMTVCASESLLAVVTKVIEATARRLPSSRAIAIYATIFSLGPLLGSLITEPAAMTVTALLAHRYFFSRAISEEFKYASIGLLFVNISIGGVLTPYAAPPVLLVASLWQWNLNYMWLHFAWKSIIAIGLSTFLVIRRFRPELEKLESSLPAAEDKQLSHAGLLQILFAALLALLSHQFILFIPVFIFFLAIREMSPRFKEELRWHESAWIALFLLALIVLGPAQQWWIDGLLPRHAPGALYVAAAGLTAVVDNAAITFLGAQIPGLDELVKYALVAGAIVGGGLTVIANAPNPIGQALLNPSFANGGIQHGRLFVNALPPTAIAVILFWPY